MSSAKTLQISYIGMQTQEVAIKPSVKVIMKSDTEMLDEVMVVAFGTAKKSAFTGSAAVVNTEELSKRITTNVSDALVGSVAGLQFVEALVHQAPTIIKSTYAVLLHVCQYRSFDYCRWGYLYS